MEYRYEDYTLCDDKTRLSIEAIHKLLTTTYWAQDRTREQIKTSLENSLCWGLFHHEWQIGFVRIITDSVSFYYICDFIIAEEYRDKGLGTFIMETILSSFENREMKGLLVTRDAQEFYKKFGFTVPADPILMLKK